MIDRELVVRQGKALPEGQTRDALEFIHLRFPANRHDLTVRAWVDTGIRDEEGVPTEFEAPLLYLSLSARNRLTGIGHHTSAFLADEIPLLADALRPQVEAAIEEATRVVDAYTDQFSTIVEQLKNQRSKVQENLCVAPSTR